MSSCVNPPRARTAHCGSHAAAPDSNDGFPVILRARAGDTGRLRQYARNQSRQQRPDRPQCARHARHDEPRARTNSSATWPAAVWPLPRYQAGNGHRCRLYPAAHWEPPGAPSGAAGRLRPWPAPAPKPPLPARPSSGHPRQARKSADRCGRAVARTACPGIFLCGPAYRNNAFLDGRSIRKGTDSWRPPTGTRLEMSRSAPHAQWTRKRFPVARAMLPGPGGRTPAARRGTIPRDEQD